jgi:hypothetical protein
MDTNNNPPLNPPKTPTKNAQNEKAKWATLTYFGVETRTITNLFRNTNIKFAYQTTNRTGHLLKPRNPPVDIYNMSGIYQLQSYIQNNQKGPTIKRHIY